LFRQLRNKLFHLTSSILKEAPELQAVKKNSSIPYFLKKNSKIHNQAFKA